MTFLGIRWDWWVAMGAMALVLIHDIKEIRRARR